MKWEIDMQETFHKFVEVIKSKVTEQFNKEGEIPPTWFLNTGDDNHILEIITAFKNDVEKNIYDMVMRQAIKAYKVQRYVYVSEVWYVTAPKEKHKGAPHNLRTHKDRKEALMLSAEDISGEQLFGLSDIYRARMIENGTIIDLAMITEIKIDQKQLGSGRGRFVNMFQDKPNG